MNIVSYLVSPGIRTLTMTDRDASYLESLLDVDAHVVNCHDEPEFLASLPGADIVLTWVFRQEWFSLAPRLRLVSTPAAGKDYFSVQFSDEQLVITKMNSVRCICRAIEEAKRSEK